jgi:hypothetical protein
MTEEADTDISKQSLYKTRLARLLRIPDPIRAWYAKTIVKFDYLFGLRAFGLVIYGALPASLGALGAFKPPDQTTLSSKIGLEALPYIIVVALIPVVLTFVLVRQRLANWYLLRDYLWVRAVAITTAIIAVSSLVCAGNGLLVGSFKWVPITVWWASPLYDKAWPIGVCLLLSFAYLVGSSTLFLTVVKEDGNLPLLPSKDEVDNVAALRESLRDIASSEIQSVPKPREAELHDLATALIKAIGTASEIVIELQKGFLGIGREKFYADLSSNLSNLKAAATDVRKSSLTWENYWDPEFGGKLNQNQLERRKSIHYLKGMRADG